ESALTLDNLGGTLSVSKGGTGTTTLTANGILYGDGTNYLKSTVVGPNGQLLYSNNGTPAWIATSSLGLMSGTAIGAGTAGQIAYYGAGGTNLTATSSLFIAPSGFVGIGTTTPGTKLTVVSTAGSQLRLAYDATKYADFTVNSAGELNISMNDAVSGSTVVIGDNSPEDVGLIFAGSSTPFHLALDNTDGALKIGTSTNIGSSTLLTITSAGDVGIGTTSPSAKLMVQGETTGTNDYTFRFANNNNAKYTYFRDDGQWVTNTDLLFEGGWGPKSISSGAGIIFQSGGTGTGNIDISTANSGTGRHITLIPYGGAGVGIGTTSPSALLTVGATSSQQFLVNSLGVVTGGTWQGSPVGVAYGGTGTSTTPSYGQLLLGNNSSGYNLVATSSLGLMSGTAIGSGNTGYIPYYSATGTNLTATSALFIAANGNIGIGTTNPVTRLDVVGNINSSSGYRVGNSDVITNTSRFQAASGLVGDPGYQFGNDNNSGLYSPAISNLGFSTASTERMRINSSGFIGIGTTSPLALLDVYGSAILSGANRYLNFGTATGTAGYGFFDNNGTMQWKNASGNWTNFSTSTGAVSVGTAGQIAYYGTGGDVVSGTSSLFIAPSGFVGIGTTTPGAKLTVVSTTGSQLRLAYDATKYVDFTVASNGEFTISPTGYTGGSIMTIGNNLSENVGMVFAGSSTPFYLALDNADGALKIGTSTTIGSSTLLTILKNGNVGIGTSDPGAYKLNVNGSINLGSIDGSAIYWSQGGASIQGGGTGNYLSLSTNYLSRLYVNSSGLVGIGTTSPSSKLTVYGDLFLEGTSRYLNFGTATGTGGYGFYDSGGTLQYKNSGGAWANISTSTIGYGTTGQIPYYSASSSNLTATSALFISTAGNVGIGTSSPTAGLHIYGKGPELKIDDAASSPAAILFASAGTIKTGIVRPANSNDLAFYYNGATSEAMRISESSGNVGIGTTSPSQALSVNGLMYIGGSGTSTIQNNLQVLGNLKVGT
ncbi:MAG: hypothetical protein WC868_12480, partial [Bacteroidales bacterium]